MDTELNDTLYQVLQDYQGTPGNGFLHLGYAKQPEQEDARFGTSIAISRNIHILVGASGHGIEGQQEGQVYFYVPAPPL